MRPLVGGEIGVNLICLCAHKCVCIHGCTFDLGYKKLEKTENHIKIYLIICSSPLSFFPFSFYVQNEVYDKKLRLLPVYEIIIFLFAEEVDSGGHLGIISLTQRPKTF